MFRAVKKYFLRHVIRRSTLVRAEMFRARWQYLLAPAERAEPLLAAVRTEALQQPLVAVVAMRQQGRLCPNLSFMLEQLQQHGIALVVLNNARLDATEAAALRGRCALYHERVPGHGRDFASFKLGIELLQALEAQGQPGFRRYLFVNDSVLVVPGAFERFVERHVASTRPWLGVTDSTETAYHVSSWFFSIAPEVWRDRAWRMYWSQYRPLNARSHAIKAGELRLSSALREGRWPADVEYPPARFIERLRGRPWPDLLDALQLLPQHYAREHLRRLLDDNRGPRDAEQLGPVLLAQTLNEQESTNITAYWQLLAVLEFDFPFIKRDIYYRAVFSLAQLRLFADRFVGNDEQRRYIVDRVLGVPDPAALTGLARLRWQHGLD
jgi:hypothetical protein